MSLSSLLARRSGLALLCAAACVLGGVAHAAPDARIAGLAAREKQPLLDSLSQLVGIESGSRDLELWLQQASTSPMHFAPADANSARAYWLGYTPEPTP